MCEWMILLCNISLLIKVFGSHVKLFHMSCLYLLATSHVLHHYNGSSLCFPLPCAPANQHFHRFGKLCGWCVSFLCYHRPSSLNALHHTHIILCHLFKTTSRGILYPSKLAVSLTPTWSVILLSQEKYQKWFVMDTGRIDGPNGWVECDKCVNVHTKKLYWVMDQTKILCDLAFYITDVMDRHTVKE